MDSTAPTASNDTVDSQNLEESERKSRVEDVWKQLNSGVRRVDNLMMQKINSTVKNTKPKANSNWRTVLGLSPVSSSSNQQNLNISKDSNLEETSEEAKFVAANALAAAKEANLLATSGKGKVEVTEVRDFAGEEVEVKRLIDPESKEASERAAAAGAAPTALDNVLEQIKKKPKLSVLDKTKKDWGEYKDENKGMEDELDAYKKSSNQYLDRVSFLQRTDLREFERERDARLALQAKRRPDNMREDDL